MDGCRSHTLSTRGLRLEGVPYPQLNLPRRCRRTYDAEVCGTQGNAWIAEFRMIKSVEQLGPELELVALANPEIPQDGKVEGIPSVRSQKPDSLIAELEGRRLSKRRRVKPAIDFAIATFQVGIAQYVSAQVVETDFTHQFALTGLKSATRYQYALETAATSGGTVRRGSTGLFRTAPEGDDWAPVEFAVISCQDYACRDDIGGFRAYRDSLGAWSWRVSTGIACTRSRW